MLKLSIITVTLNSENHIKYCLDSIASQTYRNIEHLIIDGCSTDNTIHIINQHQLNSIILSEPDKGIYDAMNKGIERATGDIVGFLNSDDYYIDRDSLTKIVEKFNEIPNLDACYSDLIYTNSDTSRNIRYWKSSKFFPGLFSKGWCPPHPTFYVRRLIYKRFGKFNLNYHIASDVELMMRFLEVNKINSFYLSKALVKMRIGGVSNKNIINILKLNREILSALNYHNLTHNIFIFMLYKVFSRLKQFIRKY